MISKATPIVPIYLVIDVSYSMIVGITKVNEVIVSTVGLLNAESFAADRVCLSIISFSGGANIDLPLTPVDQIEVLPTLGVEGGTSYGPVLRTLRETAVIDVEHLKQGGYRVARPVAFFLTDGQPSDGSWLVDLKALVDSKYYPTLLAFGIGDADPAVLVQLASRPELAFMAQQQIDVDVAIANYGKILQDYFRSLSRSTETNTTEVAVSIDPVFNVVPSGVEIT